MGRLGRLASTAARQTVAARAARGPHTPSGAMELTAPPSRPWHVRTLILPRADADGPFLLLINLITGRVGIAGFDDEPSRQPGRSAGHLAVLALTPAEARAQTFDFDAATAVTHPAPDQLALQTDELSFEIGGSWPRYRHRLQLHEWSLDANLETTAGEPLHWWSATGSLYRHYSAFGHVRGELGLGGSSFSLDAPISLEHGNGGSLAFVPGAPRLPAGLFHYQLGALSDGSLFALGCFVAAGVEFFRRGVVLLPSGRRIPIETWELAHARTTTIADRCGGAMEVPEAYDLTAHGPGLQLRVHGESASPSFAGRGRLASGAATVAGSLQVAGARPIEVAGTAYVEHLYRDGGPVLP
jgi:hypothetical protein